MNYVSVSNEIIKTVEKNVDLGLFMHVLCELATNNGAKKFKFFPKNIKKQHLIKLRNLGLIEIGEGWLISSHVIDDQIQTHLNKNATAATRMKNLREKRKQEALDSGERSGERSIIDNSIVQYSKGKLSKKLKEINKENPTKRFVIPKLEEVQAYIKEKNYSVNAEAFIAFYDSKGWMIGKNKIKSWKSAVKTWECNIKAKAVKEPKTIRGTQDELPF